MFELVKDHPYFKHRPNLGAAVKELVSALLFANKEMPFEALDAFVDNQAKGIIDSAVSARRAESKALESWEETANLADCIAVSGMAAETIQRAATNSMFAAAFDNLKPGSTGTVRWMVAEDGKVHVAHITNGAGVQSPYCWNDVDGEVTDSDAAVRRDKTFAHVVTRRNRKPKGGNGGNAN